MIKEKLILILMSATPIVELKGAIPYGLACGFNHIEIFILSVIGATLPAPIIMLTYKQILKWIKENKYLYKIGIWIDKKINKKVKLISKKYKFLGVTVYVSATIPPTGAWSGTAIASILNLSMKGGLMAVFIGNTIAALIVFNIAKIATLLNFLK